MVLYVCAAILTPSALIVTPLNDIPANPTTFPHAIPSETPEYCTIIGDFKVVTHAPLTPVSEECPTATRSPVGRCTSRSMKAVRPSTPPSTLGKG